METVFLNVGGVAYTTTAETLRKYPDSLLSKLVDTKVPVATHNNAIIIDRDGTLFRHVLNFLRDGTLRLPTNFAEHAQLEAEFQYYVLPFVTPSGNVLGKQLQDLKTMLEDRLKGLEQSLDALCDTQVTVKDRLCGRRRGYPGFFTTVEDSLDAMQEMQERAASGRDASHY
eukprot:TRINITY_DN67320_c3_g10_i1.p1 TRINITY_DN67320_c3_g10~~TRINITY_DN67320_c3_g10_i1.p1  ORF type:complete len:171 (+),score=12.77 TRINITY_DN67320_c3_g10_i1:35-547(+)